MIALPSIAFGGFSGSAKGVTARQVGGRSILSVKCWPTGAASGAQLIRRASLKKISKSWKELTSDQMRDWDRLAETATGQSVFGQAAQLSGMNLYVRLNANRAMAGEPLMTNAPLHTVAVPNVEYEQVVVTPELMVIGGIKHQPDPFKLVVKMSSSQSASISNGWSKTVIITPGMEDDWGEADVTRLYLKTIGVEPVPGEKVFVQAYWLDTSTGFAGIEARDTVVVTGESPYQRRVKATMDTRKATSLHWMWTSPPALLWLSSTQCVWAIAMSLLPSFIWTVSFLQTSSVPASAWAAETVLTARLSRSPTWSISATTAARLR